MSKIIDKIDNRDLVDRLEALGLSEKEARIYIALLPYRDIGTSKLIRMTGLHGQFVYDALERLEKLGLTKHVVQSGRKKFSANSPMRLQSLVEEKRIAAQSISRELQSRYSGAHEQDFEVFQGKSAFISHDMETVRQAPENTRIDVIHCGRNKYWPIFMESGYAEEYEHLREKKNIKIRYISSEEKPFHDLERVKRERWGWDHRVFPGLATGLVNTDIWHDQVHFNIFGSPILTFSITGKEIADGYREFFESLWKISK